MTDVPGRVSPEDLEAMRGAFFAAQPKCVRVWDDAAMNAAALAIARRVEEQTIQRTGALAVSHTPTSLRAIALAQWIYDLPRLYSPPSPTQEGR